MAQDAQSSGGQQQSTGRQNQHTSTQSVSDFGDYDLPIPGLDLFQQGQSFNPDEEEFRRRMQRKKKKGRRPKFNCTPKVRQKNFWGAVHITMLPLSFGLL